MAALSICFSSIKNTIELLRNLAIGKVEKKDIENIINHEDYKLEFARYKERISETEYVDYLLQLSNLSEDNIINTDLKTHHIYYKDILNNFDLYSEKLTELKTLLTPSLFEEQISIALKGLPDDIALPDFNLIFTIGIGQSFGYVFQNNIHFDFLQLVKDKSIIDFCSTIAHEVHHIGMFEMLKQIDLNTIPLEALFCFYFSGEGLAVKYCNNAEGVLSKSIYNGAKNKGLDAFSWKYLNDDFYNTMNHFRKTINDIRNNNIKSHDELNKLMAEYWMNPYTEEQNKDEIPKLKHSRLYSFGNDIWGIIHDCFGKNAVFETLKNPEMFTVMYNKSLEKLRYEQFKI